jgi:hypothetical protein
VGIKKREYLETFYLIVRDTWKLFQQDFEGDPDFGFCLNYKNLAYAT